MSFRDLPISVHLSPVRTSVSLHNPAFDITSGDLSSAPPACTSHTCHHLCHLSSPQPMFNPALVTTTAFLRRHLWCQEIKFYPTSVPRELSSSPCNRFRSQLVSLASSCCNQCGFNTSHNKAQCSVSLADVCDVSVIQWLHYNLTLWLDT